MFILEDEAMPTPFLSFVIASRNDNYAGNLIHRMQVFINVLMVLGEKHNLNAELVIVEWNPPEDRPLLREVLCWPEDHRSIMIRTIEVPREMHRKLPNSDRIPIFEYIAKNVGIQHAIGEYVLATNPDLVYSEALVRFLASRKLSNDSFYRIDRHDVAELIPLSLSVQEQLKFCEEHTFQVRKWNRLINIKNNTHDQKSKSSFKQSLKRIIKSFRQSPQKQTQTFDTPYEIKVGLHTHASGDFFLMANKHWQEIRGYPEFTSHSFIDGYVCFQAAALGLKQKVLENPLTIYHQEHDRSVHASRPTTDYQQYQMHGKKMLESGHPIIFNDEKWGLSEKRLAEFQII